MHVLRLSCTDTQLRRSQFSPESSGFVILLTHPDTIITADCSLSCPHQAKLALLDVRVTGLDPPALGDVSGDIVPAVVVRLPPFGGTAVVFRESGSSSLTDDVRPPGDELPATVGAPLLLGTGGVFLPATGSSTLAEVIPRRRALLSGTGRRSESWAPVVMMALLWRKATITCPLTLVPMMRAWAEGESNGFKGDEADGQNCRMVAPSGV